MSSVPDFAFVVAKALAALEGWTMTSSPRPGGVHWIEAWPEGDRPEQGWKLHVSAVPGSAADTLLRALPILVHQRVGFKVARTLQDLAELNQGDHGLSQVGKFITVYPSDDEHAVAVAELLDDATSGLPGPSVPSDHPLRPGSVVHYRYGSFGSNAMQLPHGEIVSALVDPSGRLVPDRREPEFTPPEWVEDPFIAAGVAEPALEPTRLIGGRFLPVATLHRSPWGGVELALDLEAGQRCVVKRARVAGGHADRAARLRHERDLLAQLRPLRRTPEPYALVDDEEGTLLAMQDMRGATLAERVGSLRATGRIVAVKEVIAAGMDLARALGALHGRGIVHRDLKPSNLIIGDDRRLWMIDLELAHRLDDGAIPYEGGSIGYMSPDQREGGPVSVADDIFAFGGVLYFLCTGLDLQRAPDPPPPAGAINLSIGPGLEQVIARCLAKDPARRPGSMHEVALMLSALDVAEVPEPPYGEPSAATDEPLARERAAAEAWSLGQALLRAARPSEEGIFWPSPHPTSHGGNARAVSCGTAGILLALSELVDLTGDDELADLLVAGCRHLRAQEPLQGAVVPGLYVGEAGVALAHLRAGQILGSEELVAEALAHSRTVARLPHVSPDLFHGTAGRARAHLILHGVTGEPAERQAALAAGDFILDVCKRERGEASWKIPPGHGGLSGHTYLGYAHGAAGIGDVLLDLYETTGESRFADGAAGAVRLLLRLGQAALNDDTGLEWPAEEGSGPAAATWCHGAGGNGHFLARAGRLCAIPEAEAMADRAARTVARGGRSLGPVLCHGLAGSIELLLDRYQASGEGSHLAEARSLATLLDAYAVDVAAGRVWLSDRPRLVAPDYLIGYSGVAVTQLRLADPESRPRQLTLDGFRFRATPDQASIGSHRIDRPGTRRPKHRSAARS